MAITTPIIADGGLVPIARENPWAVNFPSANFGVGGINQELKAAPGAGKATYMTHVTMCLVDSAVFGHLIDAKVSLVDGSGDTALGPIQLQAQGGSLFQKDWPEDAPLKITDNKALDCTGTYPGGSYNSAILVYVEGFTAQKPI